MSIYEKTTRLFDKIKEAMDKCALTKGSGKGARRDGETVTVVLDRRTAENAYYALALALGGVDRPGPVDEWTGKKTGKTYKGNGKTVGKAFPRTGNLRGIMILEGAAHGTVDFQPDVPCAGRGQPLGVEQGDNVTWNNRTNRALVLESIPPGIYLTEEIPPGEASSPEFPVTQEPGTRITYSCKDPSRQQHSIVVVE